MEYKSKNRTNRYRTLSLYCFLEFRTKGFLTKELHRIVAFSVTKLDLFLGLVKLSLGNVQIDTVHPKNV